MQVVNATYPLYLYGSIMGLNNPPVVAAAKAELNQQELTVVLAEQKVILDVFNAFSQAIWYRDMEHADESIIKLSQQALDIDTDQVALGLKIPQAIELAKSQLAAGQQAAASARHNAADATSELAAIMGRGSDTALELDDSKRRLPPLQPLNEFLARTMPSHPGTEDPAVQGRNRQTTISRRPGRDSAHRQPQYHVCGRRGS